MVYISSRSALESCHDVWYGKWRFVQIPRERQHTFWFNYGIIFIGYHAIAYFRVIKSYSRSILAIQVDIKICPMVRIYRNLWPSSPDKSQFKLFYFVYCIATSHNITANLWFNYSNDVISTGVTAAMLWRHLLNMNVTGEPGLAPLTWKLWKGKLK